MDVGLVEFCALLAGIVGGPIALMKWANSFITDKIDDSEASTKIVLDAHTHGLANVKTRVDQIERLRITDIERIVKLETNLTNLERGQERIEHQLDEMKAESKDARAEIIDSLRELRNVSPKG